MEVTIDGQVTKAMLQEIQYHPVSDEVMHADFLRLFDDKPITISVPVKEIGVAPGVLQGGKLVTKIRKLKLKGLPNDMPQYVEINISNLDLGQGVKVEDLDIPNIEKLDVQSSVVIWVQPTRQKK